MWTKKKAPSSRQITLNMLTSPIRTKTFLIHKTRKSTKQSGLADECQPLIKCDVRNLVVVNTLVIIASLLRPNSNLQENITFYHQF